MARWLGVSDPPMVLVMLLIVMVFVASLCFSVIVSRQRQQIERLIEETAILSAELRELRAAQPRAEDQWERRRQNGVADEGDRERAVRVTEKAPRLNRDPGPA